MVSEDRPCRPSASLKMAVSVTLKLRTFASPAPASLASIGVVVLVLGTRCILTESTIGAMFGNLRLEQGGLHFPVALAGREAVLVRLLGHDG